MKSKVAFLLLFIFFTSSEIKLFSQQIGYSSPISLDEEGVFAFFSVNSVVFAKTEIKSLLNNYNFFHKDDPQKVNVSMTMYTECGGEFDSNGSFQLNTAFQMLIPVNKYLMIPLFNTLVLSPIAGVSDSILYNFANANIFLGTGTIFTHDIIGRIGVLGGYYFGSNQSTIINSGLYDELNDIGITHIAHGTIDNSGPVITFLPNISFSRIPLLNLFLNNFDNWFEFNMTGIDFNRYKLERSHKLNFKDISLRNNLKIDFINIFNSDGNYDFYTSAQTIGLGIAFSTEGNEIYRKIFNLDIGYRYFYDTKEIAVKKA